MGAESGESQPAEARENTNYQGVNDSVCHSIGWRDTASFLHQSGRMVGKLVWVNNESESIEWIGDFSCEVLITSLRIAGGFVWGRGDGAPAKPQGVRKTNKKKLSATHVTHMQHDVQLKPTFTTACSVIIVIMSAISNDKSNSRNS